MKYASALTLSVLVLLSACEAGLPDRTPGEGFTGNFLHPGDRIPPGSELQVYLGNRIRRSDYPSVTASLELDDGTPVLGAFAINEKLRLLIFTPQDLLLPDQSLLLTIAGGSRRIIIAFSTASPGTGTPPVVVIESPADGATVSGMTEIVATATDDVMLVGKVVAALDGADFAWREDAPFTFYLNSAAWSDGPHLVSVRATDSDFLVGSTTIGVVADNPAPNGVGFPIPAEGLEQTAGVIPGVTLASSLFPGVVLTVHALTDANYSGWTADGLEVGNLQGATYSPTADFGSAGVACLSFSNYTATVFHLPAGSLTLTLPDHSAHLVSLPAATVNGFNPVDGLRQVVFYVSVDGKVHWAHAAGTQVSASLPPDLSPSAALANPSP